MLALVPKVELVYQDETGSSAALTFRVAPGSTVDEAVTAAEALAASVVSLTGCVLVRRRIKYEMRPEARGVAADGSSIKHTATFFFDTDGDQPGAIVTVPGMIDDILITTDPCCVYCIDVANSAVVDFSTAVFDAGATNPFGDAVTSLLLAYMTSRV